MRRIFPNPVDSPRSRLAAPLAGRVPPARHLTATRITPILVTLLTLVLTTAATACPMCKDSIPNSDTQGFVSVPSGFNSTIYLMLAGLFAVIGLITTTLVRGARSSPANNPQRGFPLP
jgi:hypothetical protein